MNLQQKMKKLEEILSGYGSVMVAFSGGVDSTFLLAMAKNVLSDDVIAVTGDSLIHPEREKKAAAEMAVKLAVRHIILPTRELELAEFKTNSPNRCYICKKNLILALKSLADKLGVAYILHGANVDDLDDYRPGFSAAEEMGVLAPLIEAGLTKSEIRELSREMGLETWDKPSMPCLATRLPYGVSITREKIQQIEAAENILFELGFKGARVRHHEDMARIELDPKDFNLAVKPDTRGDILKSFKKLGYLYVALDLEGYVTGSMNRSIGLDIK